MIVGNGDIAKEIKDKDDLLFFASGVSNSKEIRESEFLREEAKLFEIMDEYPDAHVVYFSTLSIFYTETPYTKHKKKMEKMILGFKNHTIIRLGNITWGTNPHTLINNLRLQKLRGKELRVDDVYRYICDQEEFQHWLSMIPKFNCEMNVPGRRMKVEEIVKEFIFLRK